jgi:DNA-binding XRE family transcriptional regulator
MKTFRKHLQAKLADGEFANEFAREAQTLRIAYEIHQFRIRRGLTQRQLAMKAGITQQMLSRVENASMPNMTYATIYRIASALGMDIGLVQK